MRKLALLLAVIITIVVFAALAMATTEGEEMYPAVANVSGLTPFTAETNYMSLPGYLRYETFTVDKVWMSRLDAVREVKIQHADPTLGCPDAMVLNGCRAPK